MNSYLANRRVTRQERAKRTEENRITCQEVECVHYPKKQSRVGQRYQATDLPVAGTHEVENGSEPAYDQVWDPTEAEGAEKVDFVHQTVTHSKKEVGMILLHERGYKVSGFFDAIANTAPVGGSNWSREERVSFHQLVFSYRKNIGAVAKVIGKSVSNCLTYYYDKYKLSGDYMELKRMLARVKTFRRLKAQGLSEQGDNLCACCDDDLGDLLHCVDCEKLYHAQCVKYPQVNPTSGTWLCESCTLTRNKPKTRRKRKSGAIKRNEKKKRSTVVMSPGFHVGRRYSRRLQPPMELCLMA